MKIIFLPVSLIAGLAAGQVGKKIFDVIWGHIDDEESPHPKYREISVKKLVPALLLEGAIFRLVKGMADHGMRRSFARVTGSWPGEERPEVVT